MHSRAICCCISTQNGIQRQLFSVSILHQKTSQVILVLSRGSNRYPLCSCVCVHFPWSFLYPHLCLITMIHILGWDTLRFKVKVVATCFPLSRVPIWQLLPSACWFPKTFVVSFAPMSKEIRNTLSEIRG